MSARGGFGSLLLAAYRGDDLVCVGSVETRFDERQAVDLRTSIDRLPWKKKQPPLPSSDKRKVVWIAPILIAEIEYRAWTTDQKRRYAAFKGLRKSRAMRTFIASSKTMEFKADSC
ncbi:MULTISPECIES: ATP dependent DNA ligase [unclassified Rhizobium]|uniref:ATP dependent DNA ligase n=1 Tax=unclassified Rhizobium TaxID=2613769 RepID=UPI001FFDF167|nr:MULTISPECIES: hypothetical protein [unclassified Rhizobium]